MGLARRLAVYVVTTHTTVPLLRGRDVAAAALAGGATAIQLRAPELTDQELLPVAIDLAQRCRAGGVMFIVNDRLDVAVAAGADGVHLGQGRPRRSPGAVTVGTGPRDQCPRGRGSASGACGRC